MQVTFRNLMWAMYPLSVILIFSGVSKSKPIKKHGTAWTLGTLLGVTKHRSIRFYQSGSYKSENITAGKRISTALWIKNLTFYQVGIPFLLSKKRKLWDGQISQHMFSRNISFKVEPCGTSPYIWNTFIQGTTPFRGYKILSRKNVQIIFVPVISDWRDTFFLGPKTGFNLPSGDTLKKRLTTKSVDNFKFTLLRRATAFTRRTISLKLMYFTCGNATHHNAARDKVNLVFLHIVYLLEIIIAADPETK